MSTQLIVVFVVEPFHGRFLDRPVHPLHLAIGPRMVGLGESVLDAVRLADHVEAHWPGVDGVPVPQLLCELNAIVGKNRVDLVGYGFEHVLQELPGCLSVRCRNQLGDSELGRPVDSHKEKELSFGGLHLGNVDVEEADGVPLELLPPGLVTLHIRQTRDAVPLQAPMQCSPREVRNRGLQSIEAVVQRQQCVPSKGDDRCLLFLGQHCRPRFLRPGLHVLDRRTFAPLRYRLGVDAQFSAQLRERSLRSLYCCSDGVRG